MARIRIPGLPDDHGLSDSALTDRVVAAVQDITRASGRPDPSLRIGPDLVFGVPDDNDGWKYYELIAGGTFIRDRETRVVWPFPLGKEMLADALVPLAAADRAAAKYGEGGRKERRERDS